MKKLISTTLVLLLLTSCTKTTTTTDDFIHITFGQAVYNDILIDKDRNTGSMQYTDLETKLTISVCSRPGCDHKQNTPNCTAQGEGEWAYITTMMIYGDNLYFVNQVDNAIQIYKCDLFGGNRKQMFSYAPEDTDDVMYMSPILYTARYTDSELYLLARTGIWKEAIDDYGKETVVQTNFENWFIIRYDFASEKGEIIYETGFIACSMPYGLQLLPDKSIFFSVQYNTNEEYGYMTYNELLKYTDDPDSEYYQTQITEKFRITPDGQATEYDSPGNVFGFVTDNEYIYYVDYIDGVYLNKGNLIKHNYLNGQEEIMYESVQFICGFYDDVLFIVTDYDNEKNEAKTWYYRDGEWTKPHVILQISGETKSYFLGFNNNGYKAILKSDYYAGIDTSFEIG
ncbi:MAG: hypothetical protein FWD34_06705 [Oscillospiraceae bacterium]|nr:hypothetical protein [Oscillospiraceae bacterium]